ncbi:MAG: universal stress protein [Planctomycetaceae bacterium]
MTIRLKRILFPTDFSTNAKCAQDYACELARQFQAELHVLYVLQDVSLVMPEPGLMMTIPALNVEEMKQSALRALKTVPDSQWPAEKVVRTTRMGAPFVEIVRYAAENAIDLIVMGTHGRSGLPHVLLGSVAEKVVRKAGCPVLTVRPSDHQFVLP